MAKKQAATAVKRIKIRQVRSIIGGTDKQKNVLRSLGLKRMNQVVEHNSNEAILGMVRAIPHLVEVVEE
jgi:large subunit ribosomal protein L30